MVVLGLGAEAPHRPLDHRPRIGGQAQRHAHPRIVEGRLGALAADHRGPGRGCAVQLQVRHLLQRLELMGAGLLDAVHLVRRERANPGGGVVTQVHHLDGVEPGTLAPVVRARHEATALLDFVLDQLEGAGAVRAHPEDSVLLRIEHRDGVVVEMLRYRELRDLEVESQGVGVDALDRIGVPQAGGLVARVVRVLLQHVALHEAEGRGAGLRIEHVLQVPDCVVGGELPAVAPLDPLAHVQGPGLEVRARLPSLQQLRAGDVVVAGARQVLAHLGTDIGLGVPLEDVGVRDFEDLLANLQRAALGQRRPRLPYRPSPDHDRGRARRQPQQGGGAQELSASDSSLSEVAPKLRDVRMFT